MIVVGAVSLSVLAIHQDSKLCACQPGSEALSLLGNEAAHMIETQLTRVFKGMKQQFVVS